MFLYKLFNDLPAPHALSVEIKRFKDLYYDIYQNLNSGNRHHIEWNVNKTFQNIKRGNK